MENLFTMDGYLMNVVMANQPLRARAECVQLCGEGLECAQKGVNFLALPGGCFSLSIPRTKPTKPKAPLSLPYTTPMAATKAVTPVRHGGGRESQWLLCIIAVAVHPH